MLSQIKEIILNKIYSPFTSSIGIIGLGVVGSAVAHSYDGHGTKLVQYDTDPKKNHFSTYEDLKNTEAIFVCVPSPVGKDSRYDTSALETVLENLKDYRGVIISKVTATPDIYRKLGEQYPNLVHCPEFLTAANPNKDYINSKFMIIGGSVSAYQREAERIIKIANLSNIAYHHCSLEEAATVKIAINSFLATKVVFMNELYCLCSKNDIDFNLVTSLMINDQRIGSSHTKVPGPDGFFGFGGMCFPKDTTALLKFAEDSNIDMSVLQSAVKKNTILRLKK